MFSHFYRKHQSKSKRKNKKGLPETISGFVCFFLAGLFALALAKADWEGRLGFFLRELLLNKTGAASALIALYCLWMGFLFWRKVTLIEKVKTSGLFFLLVFSFAGLLTLVAPEWGSASLGGSLGQWFAEFFTRQVGVILTFILSCGGIFAALSFLLGHSPLHLLHEWKEVLQNDWKTWQKERQKIQDEKKLKKKIEDKTELPPFLETPAAAAESEEETSELPAKPRIQTPEIIDEPQPSIFSHAEKSKEEPGADFSKDVSAPPSLFASATHPSAPPAAPLEPPNYESYRLPGSELLTFVEQNFSVNKEELYANGELLEKTLEQFGVKARVIDIHPGPVITRYDMTPAPGVRVQQIETLANDIALAMKASSLRVLAPVPGKAAVGIEIPNGKPITVYFKELLLSKEFQRNKLLLPLALGKTAEGAATVADLAQMPHLLIAGATGSGKSVCIHSLVLSILYRFRPDEVKLFLIDPKRLELSVYDGIPHLYDPSVQPDDVKVVTRPKEVVRSLKKLVDVMDDRYRAFAKLGVRNIESYNAKAQQQNAEPVPYIVVIIDELADLMVVVGKEIEDLIQRLAQMARAVGIHLVLATQRPSVDVITGVIKANLPSRIAFQVLSKMDSRVILDSQGAEDLIGRGDMLYLSSGAPKPVRLQGALVSEEDVARVVEYINAQKLPPYYETDPSTSEPDLMVEDPENRQLLIRAARVVREFEKVSGDLLRADKEIGSRYDLALTLLKKKGLIEKPKDTNRWRVHFDRLAEFLFEIDRIEN